MDKKEQETGKYWARPSVVLKNSPWYNYNYFVLLGGMTIV